MPASCPISSRRVDSNAVRLISLQTALFALSYILSQEIFFAAILALDFALRTFRRNDLSVFAITAGAALSLARISPSLSDEAPKRFALHLGNLLTVSILGFHLSGFEEISLALAGILLLCGFLEAAFGFCVGCVLYTWMRRMGAIGR